MRPLDSLGLEHSGGREAVGPLGLWWDRAGPEQEGGGIEHLQSGVTVLTLQRFVSYEEAPDLLESFHVCVVNRSLVSVPPLRAVRAPRPRAPCLPAAGRSVLGGHPDLENECDQVSLEPERRCGHQPAPSDGRTWLLGYFGRTASRRHAAPLS